jgi:hypothetical protein
MDSSLAVQPGRNRKKTQRTQKVTIRAFVPLCVLSRLFTLLPGHDAFDRVFKGLLPICADYQLYGVFLP